VKRCKHSSRWMDVTVHNIVLWKCVSCDEVLSLGPAADDKPEVQIEIRAVDIVTRVLDFAKGKEFRFVFLSKLGCDGVEIAGWLEAKYDSNKLPEQPGEHAGYLARLIYEHKE
jgi:hypothetical protein